MELGQTAILRSIEILQNMGCDMRVLQMEGAKDPDEYVIKYGNVRFQNLMEKALSLVEYKVKILKKDLNEAGYFTAHNEEYAKSLGHQPCSNCQ